MKRFLFLCIFIFVNAFIYSQVLNDAQIIKTGHWVYEKLDKITREQKKLVFNENSMLSVSELKFYLNQIDYEQLSDTGKEAFSQVENFLYNESNLLKTVNKALNLQVMDDKAFSFDLNLIVNPEVYYKSNENIPWSFHYYFNDNLATVPVKLGFSKYVAIENDLFIGKSYYGSSLSDSFCNIPYRDADMEFLFNRFGYGNVGLCFDNWGFNFQVGKEGLKIGNSQIPSIIYDESFETDGFVQLNLFTKSAKYSLDVTQVDYNKYLYLHQLEFILLERIKFAIIEGSQVCEPFQLRFLNPFLFMHQLSGWNDYSKKDSPYGEEKFCAYFAWIFECIPFKNTRIYAMYSQNEITPPNEQTSESGCLYPDSLGLQIGTEISIPSKYNGYWNIGLEGVYTSPYLYVKHTPEASLYRTRKDNLHSDNINTWIGSPYGPDSIAGKFTFGFDKIGKWNANITYLYAMKGEKDFAMFNENDNGIYNYYPPVKYELEHEKESYKYEEEKSKARNMMLSGVIQYTNQIGLNGEYVINNHLKTKGQVLYSFIYNCKNIQNVFDHGIELSISMTYNLF